MNELRAFFPMYTHTGPAGTPAGTNANSVSVTVIDATPVASGIFPGVQGNNGLVQIRVANKTNMWQHINFGVFGAVVAATINSTPFAPGSVEVVSVDPEVTGASVFSNGAPGGSAIVMFTRGSGTV